MKLALVQFFIVCICTCFWKNANIYDFFKLWPKRSKGTLRWQKVGFTIGLKQDNVSPYSMASSGPRIIIIRTCVKTYIKEILDNSTGSQWGGHELIITNVSVPYTRESVHLNSFSEKKGLKAHFALQQTVVDSKLFPPGGIHVKHAGQISSKFFEQPSHFFQVRSVSLRSHVDVISILFFFFRVWWDSDNVQTHTPNCMIDKRIRLK